MSDIPVKVALRARPLIQKEITEGCENVLDYDGNQLIVNSDKAYTYDYVFNHKVCQSYVYETAVVPLVNAVMDGYNATVLAYGQTGSGKTFTMGSAYTNNDEHKDEDSHGVIPRVIKDIFSRIQNKTTHMFCVKLSYLEIYKEEIKDLFRKPGTAVDKHGIQIRDAPDGSTVITGLTEIPVTSSQETFDLMDKGNSMRSTAATAMNATSSRSHAVFTVLIECKRIDDDNDVVSSRFHLVDLAGSERANRTKAQGERFDEGVQINKGLLALGNVISALGSAGEKGVASGKIHVGYRNSKLTRLLQESLGGNSRTVMIACVSPADSNMIETTNTLRYADRVRKIKNKPIVNRDPQAAEIINLKKEVQRLRLQILEGRQADVSLSATSDLPRKGGSFGSKEQSKEIVAKYVDEINTLKSVNKNLSEQLQQSLDAQADSCEQNIKLEIEKEFFESSLKNLKHQLEEITHLEPEKIEISNDAQVKSLLHQLCSLKKLVAEEPVNAEEVMEQTLLNTVKDDGNLSDLPESDMKVDTGESPSNETAIANSNYSTKTAIMSKQLHELTKALNMKEELAKQLTSGDEQLKSVREQYENKIAALDKKIAETLKEKDDLNVALQMAKKNKENNKISEQRRKRLQELEAQIQELKKEKKEKEKMVKLKQQSDVKINKLNSEIQQMKSCRVKLMRQIKSENDKFREMKKQKDREVKQLQEKNRKRQVEISKLERNFNKQQAVLRRKTEEAAAAKRRLNLALTKQKAAAEKRQHVQQNGMNGVGPKVRAWVDEEVELMLSINSVKHHLDILLEDRKTLKQELEENLTQNQSKRRRTFTVDAEQKEKCNKLQEELSLKNAQIKDFQSKLADVEEQQKKTNRWANIGSMNEARCAMKHLMTLAVKSKDDAEKSDGRQLKIFKEKEEVEKVIDELKNKIKEMEEEVLKRDNKHEEQLIQEERIHQEKVLYLMNQINENKAASEPNSGNKQLQKHIEFQAKELTNISRKNSELESENTMLRNRLSTTTTPNTGKRFFDPPVAAIKKNKVEKKKSEITYKEFYPSEEEDSFEDEGEDYVPTPIRRKLSREKRVGCGCLTSRCGGKRCKCTKNGNFCTDACKCSNKICCNYEKSFSDNEETENGGLDSTFTVPKPTSRKSTYTPTFFESPLKEIVGNVSEVKAKKTKLLPQIDLS